MMRTILALLALCMALPAAAMPCAPAPHRAAGMVHHLPDEAAPAPHVCVGCVPVGDWLREAVAAPFRIASAVPMPVPARLASGEDVAPALPPPRRA